MQDEELEKAEEDSIARWKRQQEQDESRRSRQTAQILAAKPSKKWLVTVIVGSLILISAIVCFVLARIRGAGASGIEDYGLDGAAIALFVVGVVVLSVGISVREKRRKK